MSAPEGNKTGLELVSAIRCDEVAWEASSLFVQESCGSEMSAELRHSRCAGSRVCYYKCKEQPMGSPPCVSSDSLRTGLEPVRMRTRWEPGLRPYGSHNKLFTPHHTIHLPLRPRPTRPRFWRQRQRHCWPIAEVFPGRLRECRIPSLPRQASNTQIHSVPRQPSLVGIFTATMTLTTSTRTDAGTPMHPTAATTA